MRIWWAGSTVLFVSVPLFLIGCEDYCIGGGELQVMEGDCDSDGDCTCGAKCGSANCLYGCNANIFGDCDDCCYCEGAPWPEGDAAPEGCFWDGTAPFCNGYCPPETTVRWSGQGGNGAQCSSGQKVLCCYEDSSASKQQITHGATVMTEIENECQRYTTELIQDYGCDNLQQTSHQVACEAMVTLAYCAFMELTDGQQLQCELSQYLPGGAEPSNVGSEECWNGALASLGVRVNPCSTSTRCHRCSAMLLLIITMLSAARCA